MIIDLKGRETGCKIERIAQEVRDVDISPSVSIDIILFNIDFAGGWDSETVNFIPEQADCLVGLWRFHGGDLVPLFFLQGIHKATLIPLLLFIQTSDHVDHFLGSHEGISWIAGHGQVRQFKYLRSGTSKYNMRV